MDWHRGLLHGLRKALRIYVELAVIIIPFFLFVTFLKYTQLFPAIEATLNPFMGFFGLSGKATIVIITGFFASIYGAVGIIPALDLTLKEITILGVMVTICHEAITEGAILKKLRANYLRVTALRFLLAFIAAFLLNLVL